MLTSIENHCSLIQISVKFGNKGSINNKSAVVQLMNWHLQIPSHYLNQYNGVRQNDWETRPPPGNYSTASDTWIQVSTNKMPAPDYACWRSNNSHCDVIMSRLWLWWSWRPHNLRFPGFIAVREKWNFSRSGNFTKCQGNFDIWQNWWKTSWNFT